MFLNYILFKNNTFKGFKEQAMAVTADPEHKFELALNLGNLQIAKDLAEKSDVSFFIFYTQM